MESGVMVSVVCFAYNHEKFIKDALEGFVRQKTNFKFEVIIHDDASTDNTAQIIRKYENKYPDIIKPIYENKNQYSKGLGLTSIIKPYINGKYIALCEGDDYWIDNNKLQRQFDFMEGHPECSMCTHNTLIYDLSTGKERTFNNWSKLHELNEHEVFIEWLVHTSSYFFRASTKTWNGKNYWFGDYVRLTWAIYCGKVMCLPYIMSVYRYHNPNGVMSCNANHGVKNKISQDMKRVDFLKEYNHKTNNKFDCMVKKRISDIKFTCLCQKQNYIIHNSSNMFKKIYASKKVHKHKYYPTFLSKKTGIAYLKSRVLYEGYIAYPIWILLRKIYKK